MNSENPILQRLLDLMRAKGVSEYRVTKELHMSGSSFADWKKGKASPGVEALSKMAPYFGVSLDYLITGHDYVAPDAAERNEEAAPEPEPSKPKEFSNPMDEELLAKFHRLPVEYQGKVMSYLDGMLAVLPQMQMSSQVQPVQQETLPVDQIEDGGRMLA